MAIRGDPRTWERISSFPLGAIARPVQAAQPGACFAASAIPTTPPALAWLRVDPGAGCAAPATLVGWRALMRPSRRTDVTDPAPTSAPHPTWLVLRPWQNGRLWPGLRIGLCDREQGVVDRLSRVQTGPYDIQQLLQVHGLPAL